MTSEVYGSSSPWVRLGVALWATVTLSVSAIFTRLSETNVENPSSEGAQTSVDFEVFSVTLMVELAKLSLAFLSYHVSKDCFHGKLGGEEIGVRAPPPDGVAFASDAETPLIRERAGAAAAGSDDDAAAGEARSALPALDDPRRSAPPSQPLAWYMREAWIYAVPAAFYLVDNNVVFSIMKYIDPATALLFSNVRIVFTAFLYRVFLGRLLSSLQWAALLLLLVGMLISGNSGGAPNSDVLGLHGAVLIGFGFVCIASFSASFGNIFTEYIYKRRKGQNLHIQNMLLYAWGALFNFVAIWVHDGARVYRQGLFSGFSSSAYALIFINAVQGLSVAFVLKWADNIVHVFVHAAAVFLTATLSMFVFVGYHPSLLFFYGFLVVSIAAVVYNHPRSDPRARVTPPDAPREDDGL